MRRVYGFNRNSLRGAFTVGDRSRKQRVPKQNKLSPELEVSSYETMDKRYVAGKIQSVTYHNTDWWKCFHPNISDEMFTDAVRGFCMENIACSFPDAILVLQCMPDKNITGYADFFNTVMNRCNDYLRCVHENTRSM